jgi:HK97 gp10 family phage protein
MSVSFNIVRYGDRFWEVERRAKSEAAKIASETATVTASVAYQLSPVSNVDHEHMRDTIYIEQTGETRFAVGVKAPYAIYVHNGTIYQDANPFLFTALEFARKDFKKGLAKFFKNVSG